jgi:hypothetical protein
MGYNKSEIISEVENSTPDIIAYSSFEESGRGNWEYAENAVKRLPEGGVTGQYVYDFCGSPAIYRESLPSKEFIVSYWSNKPCTVNNVGPTLVGKQNTAGWTLYTHYLSPSSGKIEVHSDDAIIDELRLYPSDSKMKTFTHIPMVGLTNVTDERDKITAYTYDGLQRLEYIKDFNGFVKTKYNYSIANSIHLGPIETLYYNQRVSADFTKACPSGQYGSVVTYIVPEGTYSSTMSAADAQNAALADIASNGQAYANLNGECKSNEEIIWEPIDLYCQVESTGNANEPTTGYSLNVVRAENTTEYVNVTLSRSNSTYRSKANFEIYFLNNNKISGSAIFEAGELTKIVNISTYPYLNSNTQGWSVVSIETSNQYNSTGISVYAQRQKKVGGQIVLTEPNLKGVGEGPYYEVIKEGFPGSLECLRGIVPESPIKAAYSNSEGFYEFYKNDCPNGQSESRVTYQVPAGKYTSSISQADANAKAKAEADLNGQAYANENGTCPQTVPCNGIENKIINGVCQTGQKKYTSSVFKPGPDNYLCTYHYAWSDGSRSEDYQETNETECVLN